MSIRERLFNIARAEWSAVRRRLQPEGRLDLNWPPEPEPEPRPQPSVPPDVREAFANLEVPMGASPAEAKAAYRRLVRKYHPDLHRDPDKARAAAEVTRQLRTAYERIEAWHLRQ